MARSVLIVENSNFMRRLLREVLKADHEIVGEAVNGVEAVEMYDEREPDVVTMEVVMPIRDGIEATVMIKQQDPGAKVIMCTSVGEEEKMREAIEAGADGYITKPFQKSSVLAAIDDVVARN